MLPESIQSIPIISSVLGPLSFTTSSESSPNFILELTNQLASRDTITVSLISDDVLANYNYPLDGDKDGIYEGSPEDDIILIFKKPLSMRGFFYFCCMFLFIGTPEIVVILLFIVIFFGSKKIPELARGIGKAMREVKDASNDIKKEIRDSANSIEDDLDIK